MLPNKPFMLLEAEAMKFVEEKHRSQNYGDYPYHVHLYHVVSTAKKYGLNDAAVLACYLHDALEDSATSYNDVKQLFGEEVADIVYLVTDEKGKNRRERHRKTYPQILTNIDAVGVKLCDRVSNVEFGISVKDYGKMGMYVKEHNEFVRVLKIQSKYISLWEVLDQLNNRAKTILSHVENN